MNRRFLHTFASVGVVVLLIFLLLIVRTNKELFKDIESYQRLLKDMQEKTGRMTMERNRWEDKYARTRESWIEWQIASKLKDTITSIEAIELGKNSDGIAYVQEGGSQKRYAFRYVFDRNNTVLLTDVQPLP